MLTISNTRSLELAASAWHKGVRMHVIIVDGWSRGLSYQQTRDECLQAGYGLCICEPEIKAAWQRLDEGLAEYEAEHALNYNPADYPQSLGDL